MAFQFKKMKKIKCTILFLVSSSFILLSQHNKAISLQINQISVTNLNETVETEDVPLFTSPTENDSSTDFNININYITPIKSLPFVFQFGYSQIDQKGSLKRIVDTFSVENNNFRRGKSLVVGAGLSSSAKVGETNFGIRGLCSLQFGYNFGRQSSFQSYTYSQNNSFITGNERTIDFARSFMLGLNLEASVFYTIKKKVSVGVGIKNLINCNLQKGNTTDKFTNLTEGREVTDQILVNHIEDEKRFFKNIMFSVNITYGFN